MRKTRGIATVLIAAMTINSFSFSATAGELENEDAVAGFAVALNNYYSENENADDEILDYLEPLGENLTFETEAVEASEEDVKTILEATVEDPTDASEIGMVSVAGYLNVRDIPSTKGHVIGRLYSHCQVVIADSETNDEGDWYYMTCGDVTGYVSAAYVLTGEAARIAENNIDNRFATVLVDSLDVFDTASTEGRVLSTVHKDEEYRVLEIQDKFVKILISDNEVGYVSKDGVRVRTQFTEALKITDQDTRDMLEGYMNDINYAWSVYNESMEKQEYVNAYSAMSYIAELLGYYQIDADKLGLTDLVNQAAGEQADAQALADKAYVLMEESKKAAEQAQLAAAQEIPVQPVVPVIAEQPEVIEVAEAAPAQNTVSQAEASNIIGIEACYNGGSKTAGDVISASEIFVRAYYNDGTTKDIHEGWTSQNVGMALNAGQAVVTMSYAGFQSSFDIPVSAAAAAPVAVAAANPQPAAEQPAAAQPAAQPAPAAEQPAAQQPAPAAPVATGIEAFYTGAPKNAGEALNWGEILVRIYYNNGTYTDTNQDWWSPSVGAALAANPTPVTIYYGDFSSTINLAVNGVPSAEELAAQAEAQRIAQEEAARQAEAQRIAQEEAARQAAAAAVVPTGIEAFYTGAPKTAGQALNWGEVLVRVYYSNGTYADTNSDWWSPNVGVALSANPTHITINYGNFSAGFDLPVSAAPSAEEIAAQQAEAQRIAQEEAARQAEAQRIAQEEAARQAEAQRIAQEEAARQAAAQQDPYAAMRQQVVNYATSWVGRCNYVYGGTNLTVGGGVDCSGFTMLVYRTVGIYLDHWSGSQMNAGYPVSYEQLLPGDLVCYSGHVGIYIGNGKIVHAAAPTTGILISGIYDSSKPLIGFRRLIG